MQLLGAVKRQSWDWHHIRKTIKWAYLKGEEGFIRLCEIIENLEIKTYWKQG